MKRFNTTAVCIPSRHYMVDLSERVRQIKELVDDGKYFTINRARQYGKTTTLMSLQQALKSEYIVLSLSFEGISKAGYQTEGEFVQTFSRLILDQSEFYGVNIPNTIIEALKGYCERKTDIIKMDELFRTFRRWMTNSLTPVVLLIDEVDSAANNQVFIDFLAFLRDGYIARDTNGIPTFQSVILAGVTDVKHLKSKIRPEDGQKLNSPWNTREGNEPSESLLSFGDCPRDQMVKPFDIAADFNIDMSLSEIGIKGMLDEYESDHHTGMDTADIAKQIREYTNGYPFLVSRLCELMDIEVYKKTGDLHESWTRTGLDEAVKMLLSENNTLFQSLTKNLDNYPDLKNAIRSILMEGIRLTYNPDQEDIIQLQMYGFIRNDNNSVRIDNRIFEVRLYNLFLSEEELKRSVFSREGDLAKNIFVEDDRLNVRLILEHFIETYHQIYGPLEEKFKEKDGREQFLLYLKPIINGTGNYYIEAQTRDQKRTDVVIDYLGKQYIIELKIWHGERYNESGEKQISEYLDYFGLSTGYMLSFNFNKKKETGVKQVHIGNKVLYEGTV